MSLLETASSVTIDKHQARELLQAYRSAKAPATDEDRAIMTVYRQIARGHVIVRAEESIRVAGWNDEGMPKLALMVADAPYCDCRASDTSVMFSADGKSGHPRGKLIVRGMPRRPDLHRGQGRWNGRALLPLIPLHLRPTASLSNYHILWEADWRRVPADPLLLRRLTSDDDLWLVLAAWELTAVERAVLERRIATS